MENGINCGMGSRRGKRSPTNSLCSTLFTLLSICLFFGLFAQPAASQRTGAVRGEGELILPIFIDPTRRLERRDRQRPQMIRFLTDDDFPPFHYVAPDGQLSGFNIDLARAICAELGATCSIQARRWEGLLPALDANEGDAVIASHRISADLRRNHDVSLPVYRVPARFAGRRGAMPASVDIEALAGQRVAVVGGSAHEAYLNALFPRIELVRFTSMEHALEAMRRGEANLAFGDGVTIAFWLNGSESLACCAFLGGAFTESRYFGEGAGIVMRKGAGELRAAIDFALWRISRDGRFAKLYLKHFPVPIY
jgi:polar amino acid transport system substrate-binding protein